MPTVIRIKQPLWGASKIFKWNDHQPGWGIALDKVRDEAQRGNEYVNLEVQGVVYPTPITGLQRKLKERHSYNQNGSHLCGYLTLTDIQELASGDAQPDKTGEGGD